MKRGRHDKHEEEVDDSWGGWVCVEAAKSNRSRCRTCGKTIDKGKLRVEVVDDLEFQACGGMERCTSAPYFELSTGTVSVKKYWVHLQCYDPFEAPSHPHPPTKQYYRLSSGSKAVKQELDDYLAKFRPVSLDTLTCLACIFTFARYSPLAQLPKDIQRLIVSFLVPVDFAGKLDAAKQRITLRKHEFLEKVKDELGDD